LTMFSSASLDVIALYRSQQGSQKELNYYIKSMEIKKNPLLVVGDFNFCSLDGSTNSTKHFLKANNFSQLTKDPKNIEGNLLDQAYFKNRDGLLKCSAEVHSKYYTDHKGLAINVKQGMKLTKDPTHIEGNLLDQAYFKNRDGLLKCSAEVHSKNYTDHKGLAINVKQGMKTH
jgi:hypothetical protein